MSSPHVQIRGTDVFAYRGTNKLTQAAFAKLVGVHANTISRVERTNSGNPATLMAIAKVIGKSMDQLRGEFEKQQPPELQHLVKLYHRMSPDRRASLLVVAEQFAKATADPRPRNRRRPRSSPSKETK